MKALADGVLDHLREVSDEPDLSGTKYELLEPLGRGGMGSVYLALDTELEREVALKVSTGRGPGGELSIRLRREAQIIAGLEHPGIVPVHDLGLLPDDRVYYVMKRVRGEELDAWARGRTRPAVLRLFQRICEAVAFAHARGVIHRDLKPSNVMVGAFGEALVMDWGIAKQLDGAATLPDSAGAELAEHAMADTIPASGQTSAGAIIGTPAFMAPEQARGEIIAIDARSDVYALGAILYFLFSHRPPFEADTTEALLALVRTSEPRPLHDLDPQIPRPLSSICARAMAHAAARRYPSALELADEVGRFLDGERVLAHRETLVERALRVAHRHRVVLSLLVAYLALRMLLALLARA